MSTPDKIALFTKMAEADPDNELAHFSVGKLRFEAGEHAEAVTALRRTIEINPQHSQAHRYLGEALLAAGQKDEGIEVLTRGAVLAHERGEYMPRDAMVERLKAEGQEPPSLEGAASAERTPQDTGTAAEGSFCCGRCRKQGEPLAEPPVHGELGAKIQATICSTCWAEWMAMSIKVINEYRLNLASPQADAIYESHMVEFLGLS